MKKRRLEGGLSESAMQKRRLEGGSSESAMEERRLKGGSNESAMEEERWERGNEETLDEEENERLKEKVSSIEKNGAATKKRKRSKLEVPCHEMVQFENKDFHGILKMYLNMRDKVPEPEIILETTLDDETKVDNSSVYLTICKAGGETGKGLGLSKKKSRALACLDIIQKLGLVPEECLVDTMAVPASPNPKRVKTLLENGNYLCGNFREALREHLQRSDPDDDLILESTNQVIVTTCRTKKGKYHGRGEAQTRKKSVHLACLDVMLNMGLLTKEQHQEKHPDTITVEHNASKSEDE